MGNFVDYGNVYPTRYLNSDATETTSGSLYDNGTSITLSPSKPAVTLDYGTDVAGFPFFVATNNGAAAQIEVRYSESLVALSHENADGPWTFSNGLSGTFRVETFEVTESGYLESFFVQGGQRWQSIRLLGNESITIERIGFRATSEHTAIDRLPGYLKTSHDTYNKVFGLGGRVVQVACVDAGNAPSTWELTNEGALVRGQASAQSAKGVLLNPANYTLEFSTKVVRGGVGWRIASASQPLGPYFVLTSNYPEDTTFKNTNRTLLPPNTLIFNSGWSIVNQTSLLTPANQQFPLNISLEEGKWYRISTSIEEDGYRVRLDGEELALVPLPPPNTSPTFGSRSVYAGSWGFGGYQDQVAVYTNVSVTSSNGTQIYQNNLTSNDTLVEYGVAPLDHSVCLDGAKRDRLVWTGDFYHTVRVVAQTTARWDYILGSIDKVLGYQVSSGPYTGFVQISPALGTRPEYLEAYQVPKGLIDYQDLFLAGIAEYFRYTGDTDALKARWSKIKKLAEAKLAFVDPFSGLVAASAEVTTGYSFLGPPNGSAVSGLFAFTLRRLVPLAVALNDIETAETFNSTASKLTQAINERLWNPDLGTYSLSLDSPGNFSLTGIAWAILSGAANSTQIASSLAKLEDLRFGPGYRTSSAEAESPNYQLAPNPSGFLLEALFQSYLKHGSDSASAASHLLGGLWGSMVNNDSYYSGASWEYVKPDGSPGLDLYTSLAHPWGAAPSYVLPEYLLGVRPIAPGYKTFVINPAVGFLDLREASGRVPTPFGAIKAGWTANATHAVIDVTVPDGTEGVLRVPPKWRIDESNSSTGGLELLPGQSQIVLCLA
ncbi:uncharacterized protein N0V89_008122 [Didymosphaeria variabile]|uniref:Alpha-L-rhamnosidase C-terminal domain-containing protein n=1 Tax=Didymosphaeria variabile TaxID=1932322 RepID=A0A9W9C879_9PLEO|nr:uncharacterized protein N0V89_008122 [Didymosphaeria variabile]KAJ4349506.1 hypothetical protein N0V89_008122 [Didymosphaeria variabile]